MKKPVLFALVVATLLFSVSAQAVRQPGPPWNRPSFEVKSGLVPRLVRKVVWQSVYSLPAWDSFKAAAGGTWWSVWDTQTVVPLRIYGTGIPAPGAVSSATAAERHARALLVRHVDLLAPGASAGDFVLASNQVHHGVRTVGFHQRNHGLRVVGGQVSFSFKNDRMVVIRSEALPWVEARVGGATVSHAAARRSALRWIHGDFGSSARAQTVSGPSVLPIVPRSGAPGEVHFHTVLTVNIFSRAPLGRWEVYVDSRNGTPVARRQLMRYASGTVKYNAPERWPGTTRLDYPAARAYLNVDGSPATSDASGVVTWSVTDPAPLITAARGPYADVLNDAGPEASATLQLPDGGEVTWDASDNEFVDAQINAFIHVNIAKEYARTLNSFLSWINGRMEITVNIDDTCNAMSDGDSLYFLRRSAQCENTGRIADVVYHEFGHSLHANSIIPGVGAFDESSSEGIADFYSASITGDPGMGRGFFRTNDPLRHIDPSGYEYVWPDDISGDSHQTGLILSGALWDLRKDLIADLGAAEGVALTERLYYAVVQRSSDIPSSYVEVLLEDDDDGDLENGTPNYCSIQDAFGLHGLTSGLSTYGGLIIRRPHVNGFSVSVEVRDPGFGCALATVDSVVLTWQERGDPNNGDTVDMVVDAGNYVGEIPAQPDGVVVRYRVAIELSDGTSVVFPDNPADPMYEMFVGEVVEIYCTDFEEDPFDSGWTHGLTSGNPTEGADDWHWGPSQAGESAGDPPDPYTGDNVIGNDLGGGNYNGLYQGNKVNYALTPVIDATGYYHVRLQYRRWLNVEDGYFDQATIYANDEPAWSNFNSDQGDTSNVHHRDREWRFHDVDLTPYVQDGLVQVKFEIASDRGLNFGGWTIDDFCIVAWIPPYCGDGRILDAEVCDDGADNSDTEPDACRTDCQPAHCGDGVMDTGEECDDGNQVDDDECTNTCTFPPAEGPRKGGCKCTVGGTGSSGLPLFLILLVGLVVVGLRRWRGGYSGSM